MEPTGHCIFEITPIYPKGQIEKEYESYFQEILGSTKNFSSLQLQEYLYNKVLKGQKEHDEVTYGLLYSILTHPENCNQIFQTLTIITKDFLGSFVNAVTHMVYEYFERMNEISREQVLWLLNELLTGNVANANNLLIALLRCVKVGSSSPKNFWLTRRLFYVLNKQRHYLVNNPPVLQQVVYCYMNLLISHRNHADLASFVDEEVEFLLTMIYNNTDQCAKIGKEFVRVLLHLSSFGGFVELWNQLMSDSRFTNPNTNQSIVIQMINTRTSRRIITTQIPYDIEKKLIYITSQVQQYQQHYYSEWLHIQHFSERESIELIPSLVRYICSVIHPPNEVISSNIVQRWALIGQLLFIAKDSIHISNTSRLALFYDWIFFDHQPTTIMNIEPAILLIYNSFDSHPLVSLSLIEFLCSLADEYLHNFRDTIRTNINAALQMTLEMKVIPSLKPLVDFLAKHSKVYEIFKKIFSNTIKLYENNPTNTNYYSINNNPEIVSNSGYIQGNKRAIDNMESADSRSLHVSNNESLIVSSRSLSPLLTSVLEYNHDNNNTVDDKIEDDSSSSLVADLSFQTSAVTANISNHIDRNKIISGYAYSIANNHIPNVQFDLDNLTEFHEIFDEAIKKNLILLKSSDNVTDDVRNAFDKIIKYACTLQLDSEPLRNISSCIAYTRADDLSLSMNTSSPSILYYIFEYYMTTKELQMIKYLENIFLLWNFVDCRLNYVLMFYLVTTKHSLQFYYNHVKYNEKTIKNDLKNCYDYDVFVFEKIFVLVVNESPKLLLGDAAMCELLVKTMNPLNCSTILTSLTKHQFNSGLRLDNNIMTILLRNSSSWDDFTEEMFYLLLRTFRYQFDVEFLTLYFEDVDHNLSHHLANFLANGSPNLKIFTNTFMKNFSESYKLIVTQWLLKFPSMMITVVYQWIMNNSDNLVAICSFFCYLFEHNENESIKAKLKSDSSFTKILQFITSNFSNMTDNKLKERTKKAIDMIERTTDLSNRKRKVANSTNNSNLHDSQS